MQMVRPERANPVCPGVERACFRIFAGTAVGRQDGREKVRRRKRRKIFSATNRVKLVKLDFLANGGQKMSQGERFLLRNEWNVSGKEIWSQDDGKVVKQYDEMRNEAMRKGVKFARRRNAIMLQENVIWRNLVQYIARNLTSGRMNQLISLDAL